MGMGGDGERWELTRATSAWVRLARVERVGIHRGLVILARLHSDAVSSDGTSPASVVISRPSSHLRLFFLGACLRRLRDGEGNGAVRFTLAEEADLIRITTRCPIVRTRDGLRTRGLGYTATKQCATSPSSTITEPRHPTPPPLKPTMAEADDDKKWYSKPNKRESLWGLGGMAVRPFSRFSAFPGSPTLARRYRARPRGCLGAQSFAKLPPTHPSTPPSTRRADRILRRRHRLPHQEGEGREGGQEVTRSEDAHAPLSTTDAAARRGGSNFGGGFNR